MSTLNKAQVRELLSEITGTNFDEGFRVNTAYLIAMKIPRDSVDHLTSEHEEMTVRVCQTLIEFTSIENADIEGVVDEVRSFLKWRDAVTSGQILTSYDLGDENPCSRVSAVEKFISNSSLSYITNLDMGDLNKLKVIGELINLELDKLNKAAMANDRTEEESDE